MGDEEETSNSSSHPTSECCWWYVGLQPRSDNPICAIISSLYAKIRESRAFTNCFSPYNDVFESGYFEITSNHISPWVSQHAKVMMAQWTETIVRDTDAIDKFRAVLRCASSVNFKVTDTAFSVVITSPFMEEFVWPDAVYDEIACIICTVGPESETWTPEQLAILKELAATYVPASTHVPHSLRHRIGYNPYTWKLCFYQTNTEFDAVSHTIDMEAFFTHIPQWLGPGVSREAWRRCIDSLEKFAKDGSSDKA